MDISELARIQRESLEVVMEEIQKTYDRINLEQLRVRIAFGAVVAEIDSLSPGARQRMLATVENVRLGLIDSPVGEVASRLAKELIDPDRNEF